MTVNIYVYDLSIKVAVMAATEEEAQTLVDQGKVSQISIGSALVSTTEIPV